MRLVHTSQPINLPTEANIPPPGCIRNTRDVCSRGVKEIAFALFVIPQPFPPSPLPKTVLTSRAFCVLQRQIVGIYHWPHDKGLPVEILNLLFFYAKEGTLARYFV